MVQVSVDFFILGSRDGSVEFICGTTSFHKSSEISCQANWHKILARHLGFDWNYNYWMDFHGRLVQIEDESLWRSLTFRSCVIIRCVSPFLRRHGCLHPPGLFCFTPPCDIAIQIHACADTRIHTCMYLNCNVAMQSTYCV